MIGEELFAASAYLTNDPELRASLRAQDILKGTVMLIIIIGVLIVSLQSALGILPTFRMESLFMGGWR